jgi:uncharacterized protein YaiI (UPF0178 family)
VPTAEWVEAVVLPGAGSTVDDWIAEHVETGDIVVTADIPLAERCLRRGACVIGPKGHAFTVDSIGEALGMRSLMEELRQTGAVTGGPGPMTKQDRSRFLSRLDARQDFEQRRFARPVGSDQPDTLAGPQVERDAGEQRAGAVGLGEALRT